MTSPRRSTASGNYQRADHSEGSRRRLPELARAAVAYPWRPKMSPTANEFVDLLAGVAHHRPPEADSRLSAAAAFAELTLRNRLRDSNFSFDEADLEDLESFMVVDGEYRRIVTAKGLSLTASLYCYLHFLGRLARSEATSSQTVVICDPRTRDQQPTRFQVDAYRADKWVTRCVEVELPRRTECRDGLFLQGCRIAVREWRDRRPVWHRPIDAISDFLLVHLPWLHRMIRPLSPMQWMLANLYRHLDS